MGKAPVAEDDPGQDQAEELRINLQNAFSFVEGKKIAESFSTLTLEDCLDQFIERATGKGTEARPNAIDRLTQVQSKVKAAIAQIQAIPPEAFREPSPDGDVNTPADGVTSA